MDIKTESCSTPSALLEAINQYPPPDRHVALWWLGQAGFALRHGSTLLLIDPYLSDSLAEKYRGAALPHLRMMELPLDPAAIRGCDWYLCTHGHTDHMDAQTIRAVLQANAPRFVIPRALADRGRERGIPLERTLLLDAGEVRRLHSSAMGDATEDRTGDITVEAVAAAHEELERNEAGHHKFLGYILTLGDVRLYHSGDSVPYAGLAEHLATRQIDGALLPINGRDAHRLSQGVPGNFTVEEAIALCQAAKIPQLIGHHFGMFDFNTIDPVAAAAILERQAAGLQWLLPQIGVTYVLSRTRAA